MNDENKILGNPEEKKVIDDLLKQAKADKLINGVIEEEEKDRISKFGDITGLEEIEFDTRNLPRIHKTLAFHPDGEHVLLSSSYKKAVSAYTFNREDPSRGLRLYAGMRLADLSVAAFSPDGRCVATVTGNHVLGLHRFYKNEMSPSRAFRSLASIEVPSLAEIVAVHNDHNNVAAVHIAVVLDDNHIVMYEFNGKDIKEVQRQQWFNTNIYDIAFYQKGKFLALAKQSKKNSAIEFHGINLLMGIDEMYKDYQNANPFYSIDFSLDNSYMAAGGVDGIAIFYLEQYPFPEINIGFKDIKRVVNRYSIGTINSVSFDPKGDYILALDGNNEARLLKILRAGVRAGRR